MSKKPLPKTRVPAHPQRNRAILFTVLVLVIVAGVAYATWQRVAPKTASTALPPVGPDGVQVVRMAVRGLDYQPAVIPIRAGTPVRWVIDASAAEGCARTMYSRQLGINRMLEPGVTTIEFTPTKTGTIPFSCSMGMARGEFQVV